MARLRLFGHPALETAESRNALGLSPKGIAVVALVAADAQRALARDVLARKVWPDIDPPEARANLRRQLHLALKVLGEDALILSRDTVQWNAAGGVTADVVDFHVLRAADPTAAVEQYTGELCSGIAEDALEDPRIRYRSQYEELLHALFQQARSAADDAAERVWLERLIRHDPYDEDAVQEMMRLHLRSGDRAAAIRDYNALRQRLLSEIGAEPQPETAALLAQGEVPDRAVPNNLPAATTSFVGREREIAEIEASLRSSRMVTLVGAGGAGKSRLAARSCTRLLQSYGEGVWFVDLEHAKHESGVWELIANAAHAPATQPRETGVLQYLAARSCLIVLDTCEHVLAAAQHVVEKLLSHTRANIIATSRHSMPVEGSRQISIVALDAPAGRQLFLERATAVNPAFTLDKRREDSLAELLHRVDGLPLAIELLASRANVLSIDGMRARLAQTLQSPIAETLTWSYELLSQSQRRLFETLGAFRGSFTIEDAASVQNDEAAHATLRELVDASLVSEMADESVARYRLLETTRDFAESRLRQSTRLEAVLLAHARHFADKADALSAAPEAGISGLLPAVETAMPDYLAALDNALRYDCAEVSIRILDGLYPFGLGNHFTPELLERADALLASAALSPAQQAHVARKASTFADLCQQYERAVGYDAIALEYARNAGDDLLLCAALAGIGATRFHQGRVDECEALLLEVCDRLRAMGDERRLLRMTARLGTLYVTRDYDKAVELLVPAADQLLKIGEVRQAAYALRNAGAAAYITQHYDAAAAWSARGLEHAKATGDLIIELNLLTMLACSEHFIGRSDAGIARLLSACRLITKLGERTEVADSMEDIAVSLASLGERVAAVRLAGFSARVRRMLGTPLADEMSALYRSTVEALRADLGSVAFENAYQLGAQYDVAQAVKQAREALLRAQAAIQDNEDTTSLS